MNIITVSPQFIDDFADCLANPKWLPFAALPYEVVKPDISRDEVRDNINEGVPLEFCFRMNVDEPFGHLKVCPQRVHYAEDGIRLDPDRFVIVSINSGYKSTPQHNAKLKLGREFVRRAVWYAHERGYAAVETSAFTDGASSFWLGLGFRGNMPVEPDWSSAKELSQEAAQWQRKLAVNPDSIWDMARTEVGKRVLFPNVKRMAGILDFHDSSQRKLSFNRLRLPTKASGDDLQVN